MTILMLNLIGSQKILRAWVRMCQSVTSSDRPRARLALSRRNHVFILLPSYSFIQFIKKLTSDSSSATPIILRSSFIAKNPVYFYLIIEPICQMRTHKQANQLFLLDYSLPEKRITGFDFC
jgi:hypothetical protein